MPYTPYIAIDVEVTIMSYSNGMPYSIFSPYNPFISANHQSLPYRENKNKYIYQGLFENEIYWVIEEELTIDPLPLDLKKAFNCFNQISSKRALYSIKLCVDVPNNNKPTLLDYNVESETGHTFIVMTKSNGDKSVTQVFGFYATTHPGYFMPFRAVPSTIKNNQLREINASIEMALTEAQFELLRNKAFELAKNKYNAASYNCTNFGLDLFNSVRSHPIKIDSYTLYLPNHNNLYGTAKTNQISIDKTPQMLFKTLKEMNDKKSADIVIDQSKNTRAPMSNGKCD